MRFILLRFNHGVEIGARLAYLGHFAVTKDAMIKKIADEELEHKITIGKILKQNGLKPFWGFDIFFTVVGTIIQRLCPYTPRPMLNWVARTMETFAIFNYAELSRQFPEHRKLFLKMSFAEQRHEKYFSRTGKVYLLASSAEDNEQTTTK